MNYGKNLTGEKKGTPSVRKYKSKTRKIQKLSEIRKINIIFSSTQQKEEFSYPYVVESWKWAEVHFLPRFEAWSKKRSNEQKKMRERRADLKTDKLERSLPQNKNQARKNPSCFVERCSNTFWKCVNTCTLWIQQSWHRRFAVL